MAQPVHPGRASRCARRLPAQDPVLKGALCVGERPAPAVLSHESSLSKAPQGHFVLGAASDVIGLHFYDETLNLSHGLLRDPEGRQKVTRWLSQTTPVQEHREPWKARICPSVAQGKGHEGRLLSLQMLPTYPNGSSDPVRWGPQVGHTLTNPNWTEASTPRF